MPDEKIRRGILDADAAREVIQLGDAQIKYMRYIESSDFPFTTSKMLAQQFPDNHPANIRKSLNSLKKKRMVLVVGSDYRGHHLVVSDKGRKALAVDDLAKRMKSWVGLGDPGCWFHAEREADHWLPFDDEGRDDQMDYELKRSYDPERFAEWELWRDRWTFKREFDDLAIEIEVD